MFRRIKPQGASKGKKNTESTAMVLKRWCGRLTDYIVCICIIIITAILPLYFKEGYGYIATDKSLFFRQVSFAAGRILLPVLAVYLCLTALVHVQQRKSSSRKKPGVSKITDLFAGLYGLALVLSYCCSDYREQALWGAEGWYMGLFTQIVLLCIYFLIARLWKPRKEFFYLILAVSAAVLGLGYLNRFSVYPIKMEMSSPGFISTIGNINWFCGYAVTVLFGGAALFWQEGGKKDRGKGWQSGLLMLYVWLGFGTLITQGSASGIMTLIIALFFLFLLSAEEGERMCRFWLTTFLMGAACLFTEILMLAAPDKMNFPDEVMNLLITGATPAAVTLVSFLLWQWIQAKVRITAYPKKQFQTAAAILATAVSVFFAAFAVMVIFNTIYPGSIGKLGEYGIFTFSDTWGSRRGATWKAGVKCFLEQNLLHKLLGVGPDAMEAFLYRDGSQGLVESLGEVFGYNHLTNAHNEWLTVLVNTGILGLAGFAGMMVSAMVTLMKRIGKNTIAAACGFALFTYTVNNCFSFQQIMNVTQAYVLMGMGMAFLRAEENKAAG